MYNVQDISILFNNLLFVRIDMTANFTERGVGVYTISLTQPLVIEVPVPNQESQQLCINICVLRVLVFPLLRDFAIRLWICSDIVVFYFFPFY